MLLFPLLLPMDCYLFIKNLITDHLLCFLSLSAHLFWSLSLPVLQSCSVGRVWWRNRWKKLVPNAALSPLCWLMLPTPTPKGCLCLRNVDRGPRSTHSLVLAKLRESSKELLCLKQQHSSLCVKQHLRNICLAFFEVYNQFYLSIKKNFEDSHVLHHSIKHITTSRKLINIRASYFTRWLHSGGRSLRLCGL